MAAHEVSTPSPLPHLASFLTYLRKERGAGDNTLASYENDLRKFAGWLLPASLTQAQRTDLSKFISVSLAEGLSGRSVAHRLACLRHFYRFLLDEGVVERDPTRNLPVPKTWKTVPKALSEADVEKMVASLGTSWLDIRDKAMLLAFFASGLRASELVALKVEDLDLEAGSAKVWQGKGGKDGIVPLSVPAIAALREYLITVRPRLAEGGPSPFVFPGRRGARLTRQQAFYRIRDIAERVLGRRMGAHALRHGFATALVEGGADIRDVQVLMRHASVDTTAIYLHCDLKYLRRIFYECHPRARVAEAQA